MSSQSQTIQNARNPHEYPYTIHKTAVKNVLEHGKSWHRGEAPRILHIEDQSSSLTGIKERLTRAFPKVEIVPARSIEKAFDALKNLPPFDFVILDHQIQVKEKDARTGTATELEKFLKTIVSLEGTAYGMLIRTTIHTQDALKAQDKLDQARSGGDLEQVSRSSVLIIAKSTGWEEFVLAYVYRTLALKYARKLNEELDKFDFSRLNGTRRVARIRHRQIDGVTKFRSAVSDLAVLWPFLDRWPMEPSQTRTLLEPLLGRVRHFFDIDESSLVENPDQGDAYFTMKISPGPISRKHRYQEA